MRLVLKYVFPARINFEAEVEMARIRSSFGFTAEGLRWLRNKAPHERPAGGARRSGGHRVIFYCPNCLGHSGLPLREIIHYGDEEPRCPICGSRNVKEGA